MKALCVDDEALILQMVVSLCREMPQLDGAEGFTEGQKALDWLDENRADVALLDIDMPDMNGIILAGKIREKQPEIPIIFLTGYARYALDAFAIHAAGYLMKPISREKLYNELDYALFSRSQTVPVAVKVTVLTFGNFELFANGKTVVFTRSKAKELMAYLVHRQGSSINRAEAFAAIWEDGLYDRSAQKQLDVVVRSLRATLQEYNISDIFEMKSGMMRICPEMMDCDLYRFMSGDMEVIKAFRGEYMSSYSWGQQTEGYLTIQQQNLLEK